MTKGSNLTSLKTLFVVATALTMSISAYSSPSAVAAPGQVNSVNDGRHMVGGTYYNTPGSKTVFTNSRNGGLWLRTGTRVQGLQSDAQGNPNGHGGHIHLSAPGSVIRLDGTVDVSSMKNGTLFMGNGGQVTMDAAFLYQSGKIMANGINGGQVVFNLGSAMFMPQAQVEAIGVKGNGGVIKINADGVVNIKNGAILVTAGKTAKLVESNLIRIEGGLVNNAGLISAGSIVTGKSGKIQLLAKGQTSTTAIDAVNTVNDTTVTGEADPLFTPTETNEIQTQITSLAASDNGNIINSGVISVAGKAVASGNGGQGGSISLKAPAGNSINTGVINANGGNSTKRGKGGNGGSISINAGDIVNDGFIEVNGGNGGAGKRGGNGGNGGKIALVATHNIINQTYQQSYIQAHGGRGGQGTVRGGNGGNGGSILLQAENDIVNNCCVNVNGGQGGAGAQGGNGGNGGRITLKAGHKIQNNHSFMAKGGNGRYGRKKTGYGGKAGKVVFQGTKRIKKGKVIASAGRPRKR